MNLMQQYLQWWRDFVDWQQQGQTVVLVTVIRADGSTPREVGATMLLALDQQQALNQSDTIGGGQLEYQAIDLAKAMLAGQDSRQRWIERFNLSARLGQCCGGVMWLLFEKIEPDANQQLLECHKAWQNGQQILRQVSGHQGSGWTISDHSSQGLVSAFQTNDPHSKHSHQNNQYQSNSHQSNSLQVSPEWQWQQPIMPYRMKVMIFGAGHVGEAIVRCLLPIGVQITWVDTRDDFFAEDLRDQVHCIITDLPEAELDHFDRGGAILILTHDHQLDLQLCFAALQSVTQAFAFVGMIGSKSKRAIFEKRMQQRGYHQTQLEHLVCPIGIEGIHSKQPAVIAVAVVAQLLQVFAQQV